MNGWQRIGIVITVTYVLVTTGFGVHSYQNASPVVPELRAGTLFYKYRKISSEQLARVAEYPETKYQYCLKDSAIEDKRFCEAAHLFEPNFIKRTNIMGIVLALIIVPALSWLAFWVFILVGRWVRKGFQNA